MRAIADALVATFERRTRLMNREWATLTATVTLTVVAGVVHFTVGDTAGAYASALPLMLVAPLVAMGCDSLRGRLSASVVGIVQSAFGNVAEFALTLLALRANLPEVVRIAIVGSILGNALLLGGLAGLHADDPRARAQPHEPALRPPPVLGHRDARGRRGRADRDPELRDDVASSAGRRARTSRSRPASACSRSACSSS